MSTAASLLSIPFLLAAEDPGVGAGGAGSGGAPGADPAPPDARTVSLAVEGMRCEGCVATVREALLACPGVQAVEVDLEGGSATCRVAADCDPASLLAATGGEFALSLRG